MLFDKLKHLKMIVKKPPSEVIVILLALLVVPIFVFGNKYAQISLPAKNIGIDNTIQLDKDIFLPPPTILDKLSEKDDELAKVPVSIGSKDIIYYENRYVVLPHGDQIKCEKDGDLWDKKEGVCKSVTRKKISDKELVLGLKLLNTKTGEVEIITAHAKIDVNGVKIEAPDGYQIEIVERPNGIRWNYWNTLYRVITPEDTVVIKNNYPRETIATVSSVVKGRVVKTTKKVVQGFLYVPHSEFFEKEENKKILVEAGREHIKNIVSQAFSDLRDRGVQSRAFVGGLVADTDVFLFRFLERIPLLEQGDFTEFQLDPQKTAERVLIILGANGDNAWRYTCNRSDACGWVQFTPGTYNSLRTKFYASAALEEDFKEGAGDQINSMMAAILLYDYNLSDLIDKYGKKVVEDPRLEEYLAAAYNGKPVWVWNSLNATLGKTVDDWTKYLKKETIGFIYKLRYLIENDLP